MGGRLTLINSILTTIPIYYLSVLHLLKRVELEIDRIRRRFLWKNQTSSHSGYYLARWRNICRSRAQDGLGIINLSNFNLALKCKHLWNLVGSVQRIKWPSLVLKRYCALNNLGALLNMAPNGASPISKELKRCFPIVNMLSSFSLRNGKNIILWENKWLADLALKNAWPFLYTIARKKKCSIETMFLNYSDRQLEIFAVNIDSLNTFHSSCELHDFIEKMDSVRLQLGNDIVEWKLTSNRQYSVKSCYGFLNDGGLCHQKQKETKGKEMVSL